MVIQGIAIRQNSIVFGEQTFWVAILNLLRKGR
jgi:hypothetical protein